MALYLGKVVVLPQVPAGARAASEFLLLFLPYALGVLDLVPVWSGIVSLIALGAAIWYLKPPPLLVREWPRNRLQFSHFQAVNGHRVGDSISLPVAEWRGIVLLCTAFCILAVDFPG